MILKDRCRVLEDRYRDLNFCGNNSTTPESLPASARWPRSLNILETRMDHKPSILRTSRLDSWGKFELISTGIERFLFGVNEEGPEGGRGGGGPNLISHPKFCTNPSFQSNFYHRSHPHVQQIPMQLSLFFRSNAPHLLVVIFKAQCNWMFLKGHQSLHDPNRQRITVAFLKHFQLIWSL